MLDKLLNQLSGMPCKIPLPLVPCSFEYAARTREQILLVANDACAENPQIAGMLLRLKDILFPAHQSGSLTVDPVILGELIFGLRCLKELGTASHQLGVIERGGQHPGTAGVHKNESAGLDNPSRKEKRILVSHSSKDLAQVEAFVDLLRVGGFTEKHVICSSCPGYNLPYGKNVYDYLKDCYIGDELFVVFLISKDNYYGSVPCLNEMGAAWVLGTQSVPILLSGMHPEDLKGAVGSDINCIVLDGPNAKYGLNRLREDLASFFGVGIVDVDASVWERARDSFLDKSRQLTVKTG